MKTNFFYSFLILISSSVLLVGCDALTREIEVVLPPYESELVVECYLEVGKPYRLALTQTERFLTVDIGIGPLYRGPHAGGIARPS